nr:sulfatase-like hydrolase/transferase [Kribbella turkmenica]
MTTSRPNILLIMTDQHRYDVLSAYGNSHVRTPHLQLLADQGTTFETCYTTSPVCAPARASVLTGKYPHAHRLWCNGVTLPDQPLVSRRLADDGYRCGLIGKRHLSRCFRGIEEAEIDDGFDSFRKWAHDPRHGSPDNAYHRWLETNHPRVWEKVREQVDHPGADHPDSGPRDIDCTETPAHYSTWVAEEAKEFLRTQDAGQPFFLWANFYDPHHPFAAPREYLDRYPPGSVPPPVGGPEELAGKPSVQAEMSRRGYQLHDTGFGADRAAEINHFRRAYYAMVTMVDDKVGEILAALDGAGLAENTLVIFTSDHGEMLGDHGLLLKGPMAYEGAVRVPLIMRWPGTLPAGRRSSAVAGLHDVGVTIGAAAGTEPLPAAHGQDLLAVIRGDESGRDWGYVEYRDSNRSDEPAVCTTMLRSGDLKLVQWHGHPASTSTRDGELYDLSADPDELVNLWHSADHLASKADMLAMLADVRVQLEDRSPVREAPW